MFAYFEREIILGHQHLFRIINFYLLEIEIINKPRMFVFGYATLLRVPIYTIYTIYKNHPSIININEHLENSENILPLPPLFPFKCHIFVETVNEMKKYKL